MSIRNDANTTTHKAAVTNALGDSGADALATISAAKDADPALSEANDYATIQVCY
jgi:hypothetical protein